jgi:viroplasmin and RNaseH domain-containing protein
MLFGETVAVCCENHTGHTDIHINSVRTSQETHYVTATETNRLMLFRETVAVYCENHTGHADIHINSVRTSQETHYVTATDTNRLMLFRETVAVYCEAIRNTQIHSVGGMQSSSTLRHVVQMIAALFWRLRARGFTSRFRGMGNFKPELKCAAWQKLWSLRRTIQWKYK